MAKNPPTKSNGKVSDGDGKKKAPKEQKKTVSGTHPAPLTLPR